MQVRGLLDILGALGRRENKRRYGHRSFAIPAAIGVLPGELGSTQCPIVQQHKTVHSCLRSLLDLAQSDCPSDVRPENQDRIAPQQIRGRRALDDIKAGSIQQAIAKCSNIWTSFPRNTYGQNPHRLDKLLGRWVELGGTVA